MPAHSSPTGRRVIISFWLLTLVAIASAGSLSAALAAPVGPATGIRVAVSGIVSTAAAALAARILMADERARRRGR